MYECVSTFTHIHSLIHNFFSVDMGHPDLLNDDRLWEFNEKKHHYLNVI